MTRDEIIKCTEVIGKSITFATSYLCALESIVEARRDKWQEMSYAPGFFWLASNALISSIIMETSKLYDCDGESYSIYKYLSDCKKHLPLHPRHKSESVTEEMDSGAMISFGISVGEFIDIENRIIGKINELESELAELPKKAHDTNVVSRKKELGNELKKLRHRLCVESDISKRLKVWDKEIRSQNFQLAISKMRTVRNKYYAHLSREYMDNVDNLFKDSPISLLELKELVAGAAKINNGVREYLTGADLDYKLTGSGDLDNLLSAMYFKRNKEC